MKILLQNQYDDLLGGVETYFKLVADALAEKGHEVIAVYTKSGRKREVKKNGHRTFYLPNLDLAEHFYYTDARQNDIRKDIGLLKSIVQAEKPDIIHLNNTHYPAQYVFLGAYAPLIQTVHDFYNCCNTVVKMLPDAICNSPLGRDCFKNKCISPVSIAELWRFKTKSLNREAMKKFQRILVTTPYMKDVLLYNGFREDKVQALPLFVEDWKTSTKNDGNTIIYVGRLAKEKGVIQFIQMLRALNCNFKAFIIGDGPQKAECENMVDLMGLKDRVEFTGFLNRHEIKDYFAKASVVVVPSLWPEPFCLVGLEAMSCSKPVVAYSVGGIPSWLRDNYNGYLAPRNDVSGLARRVDNILKDKGMAEGMGKNGRRLFEEKFSQTVHVRNLLSVYEEVIEAGKTKKRLFGRKPSLITGARSGKAIVKYPRRSARESLPEYNKRVIEFECENKITVVRSYPEEITISTTTRCNMDPPCVICEKNLRKEERDYDIDAHALEKIKPVLKYADRIYLHCGGEPLMTEKTLELIGSVKPPTKIRFNTNGALFTDKTIRYMVDCNVVDVISFSIDAATERTYRKIRSADFNRVIKNIRDLLAYRNQANKGKQLRWPVVIINFCIIKQNMSEAPDYLMLARELGVDGVNFTNPNQGFDWQQERADYTFDYKKESVWEGTEIEEHDKFIMKAYELGKKFKIPINFSGNAFIAGMSSEKTKAKNEMAEIMKCGKKCIFPWNSAVIETDGRVRMCCFHDSAFEAIGKLKTNTPGGLYFLNGESFEEIWNGAEAVSVRQEFLDKGIAARCITKNPCVFQSRI